MPTIREMAPALIVSGFVVGCALIVYIFIRIKEKMTKYAESSQAANVTRANEDRRRGETTLSETDPIKILEKRYSDERCMKDEFYEKVRSCEVVSLGYCEKRTGAKLKDFQELTTYFERYYYCAEGFIESCDWFSGYDYIIKYKDIKLSLAANISRRCLDASREMTNLQNRTENLIKLNHASYLVYVRDILSEAHEYLLANAQRIVNYLLVDGCLENFENHPDEQNLREINALMEQNSKITGRSKELIDEAVRLVNSYGSRGDGDEAMRVLATGIQSIRDVMVTV